MFYYAGSFSQTLCWDVDERVDARSVFYKSNGGNIGDGTGVCVPSSGTDIPVLVLASSIFVIAVIAGKFFFSKNTKKKSRSFGEFATSATSTVAQRRSTAAGGLFVSATRNNDRSNTNNNTNNDETDVTHGHDNNEPSAPVAAIAMTPQQLANSSSTPQIYAHAAYQPQVHPADRNTSNGATAANGYRNQDGAYSMGQQQQKQPQQYQYQQQQYQYQQQPQQYQYQQQPQQYQPQQQQYQPQQQQQYQQQYQQQQPQSAYSGQLPSYCEAMASRSNAPTYFNGPQQQQQEP
jgi:hypothetical protein